MWRKQLYFVRNLIDTERSQNTTLTQGFTPEVFFNACGNYPEIQDWLNLRNISPEEYQPYIFMICAQLAINNHESPCNYFFNAATVFLVTDACRAAQLYYQAATHAETNASQQHYLRNALFALRKAADPQGHFEFTQAVKDEAKEVLTHTIGEDQLKSEVKGLLKL